MNADEEVNDMLSKYSVVCGIMWNIAGCWV